jgi:hypothetical protein
VTCVALARDSSTLSEPIEPREELIEVAHERRRLIDFNRLALNANHAKLIEWGLAPIALSGRSRRLDQEDANLRHLWQHSDCFAALQEYRLLSEGLLVRPPAHQSEPIRA